MGCRKDTILSRPVLVGPNRCGDQPTRQIQVLPAQPADLAGPSPDLQHDRESGLDLTGRSEDLAQFLAVEGIDPVGSCGPSPFHVRHRIGWQELVPCGPLEDQPERDETGMNGPVGERPVIEASRAAGSTLGRYEALNRTGGQVGDWPLVEVRDQMALDERAVVAESRRPDLVQGRVLDEPPSGHLLE
jgi:hypothetical protein